MHKIKSTIAGIPCLIKVTFYRPAVPAKLTGHPDTWHEGEDAEIEYEVLPPWLERKLMAADQRRIDEEIEKAGGEE